MSDENSQISRRQFMEELLRYRRGSVSRRHFLGVTGLGLATAVLGQALPGLRPRPAFAQNLGDTLNFTTWPNYFDQANFDQFSKDTGVNINVAVFGSNEEMLAKLQAGGTGWDVLRSDQLHDLHIQVPRPDRAAGACPDPELRSRPTTTRAS